MKTSQLRILSISSIASTLINCYTAIIPPTIKNKVQVSRCGTATNMKMKDSFNNDNGETNYMNKNLNRRKVLSSSLSFLSSAVVLLPSIEAAQAADETNVNDFLKTGMVSQPMGVSGQAGKSRPELGVNIRDGTEATRDKRTGSVLAEIVLIPKDQQPTAVITSFTSSLSLAQSSMFGVECRDGKTGDSSFLAVSGNTSQGTIKDVPTKFILDELFSSTGRFSSYGTPTDIKLKQSSLVENDNYKLLEVNFSTLSQSTMTEIPRTALISATIPKGLDQVVMLVSSATTLRYKKGKGVMDAVKDSAMSFRASPAPKSNLKVRVKKEAYLL